MMIFVFSIIIMVVIITIRNYPKGKKLPGNDGSGV